MKFCRDNDVKVVLFYDLSRLARSVEEGLNELKQLADEGFNFYFSGMDFLNYDIDPMLKKKVIMDFLWFAELYVEDIKKRTKTAMERLRREGKLIHRPQLLHYVALFLSGKENFSDLTKEDVDKAMKHLRNYISEKLMQGKNLREVHEDFKKDFTLMYGKFTKAPHSFFSFYRMIRYLRVFSLDHRSPSAVIKKWQSEV